MNRAIYIMLYLAVMNTIGFVCMGADKRKAIRHAWRIPEKTLFFIAAIGGSVGIWAGMYLFHHKTKHWYFVIGIPLIFAVHVMLGVFFVGKLLPVINL